METVKIKIGDYTPGFKIKMVANPFVEEGNAVLFLNPNDYEKMKMSIENKPNTNKDERDH